MRRGQAICKGCEVGDDLLPMELSTISIATEGRSQIGCEATGGMGSPEAREFGRCRCHEASSPSHVM